MSEKLLTTREAARFLRASEASVRRWTDAGLLPASRVGRRQARRFHEADLLRFMGPHGTSAVTSGMPPAVSLQGMAVPLGSHLASFYSTDADRLRLGLPFLRDGLLAGHVCVIHAANEVWDRYLQALGDENIDIDAAVRARRVVFLPARRMSVEKWIAHFERLVSDASRDHHGPIRFLGEAATGRKTVGSAQQLLVLEQRVSPIAKRRPVVMLCQYDVRAFDGVTTLESLKLHFDAFEYQPGYFLN